MKKFLVALFSICILTISGASAADYYLTSGDMPPAKYYLQGSSVQIGPNGQRTYNIIMVFPNGKHAIDSVVKTYYNGKSWLFSASTLNGHNIELGNAWRVDMIKKSNDIITNNF